VHGELAPFEVEVLGAEELTGADEPAVCRAALAAAAAAGARGGHVAVSFVSADEIHALNREHRGVDRPTDVLSFPMDGVAPAAGPRELGDVVICPEHTADLIEAVVHGVLHLCGHDHEGDEGDEGDMLALQADVLARVG
jgi:probable rRNA maturation factor